MSHKLQISLIIAVAMFCLGGCGSSGGSSDGFSVSSGLSGSGSTSGIALSTSPVSGFSNPEPLTIALFGSGLLGYALLRKRKKKK